MRGIIVKGVGGFYYIETESGLVECRARGLFRKTGTTPLVGDRVEVTDDGGGSWVLSEIYPRRNRLTRPGVANIDKLIIVVSYGVDLLLLDKMIVGAQYRGIEPVLCVNKADVRLDSVIPEAYAKIGYKVIITSAATGDGIPELTEVLTGNISAFCGNSGVGKSSLLNAVNPDYALQTGAVSKIGRGRHVTRHNEIFPLPGGGYVIDTPGFGSLESDEIEALRLRDYFIEFAAYEGKCRFADCNHIGEKGCAVAVAVQSGAVYGSRHKNYITLFNEFRNAEFFSFESAV